MIGEEIILNPLFNHQWVCHDKNYWRKLQVVDGTRSALMSGGVCVSMLDKIKDIKDNFSRHSLPTLVLTADKDKIVDNKGARDFFANIKTPPDLK